MSDFITEQIVESACLKKSDVILEIGTGTGALTEKIASRAKRVITYEEDHHLFDIARDRLSTSDNVDLVNQDAFSRHQPVPRFDVCITSLPYSRSIDFIEWLAIRSGTFRCTIAVLQLEFARKLQSQPCNSLYRAVSVIAQISFLMKEILLVDRINFDPPPRVQSVVMKFETNAQFKQPFLNRTRIQEVKRFFSFRGRLLRNAIEDFEEKIDLPRLAFSSNRIEQIEPGQFALLLEKIC